MKVDGLKCHDTLVTKLKQRFSYGTNPDYKAWKQSVKEKFIELIGLEEVKTNQAADPCFEIEAVVKKDGYTRTRFTFYSEVDAVDMKRSRRFTVKKAQKITARLSNRNLVITGVMI